MPPGNVLLAVLPILPRSLPLFDDARHVSEWLRKDMTVDKKVRDAVIERRRQAELELEEATMSLLSATGWRMTSSTSPDSVWRWEKVYKNRLLVLSETDALNCELHGIWT
jgi:hypothetical protein